MTTDLIKPVIDLLKALSIANAIHKNGPIGISKIRSNQGAIQKISYLQEGWTLPQFFRARSIHDDELCLLVPHLHLFKDEVVADRGEDVFVELPCLE